MAAVQKKKKHEGTSTGTRVLYIIIAIIASVALWAYITFVENPQMTTTVYDIPIRLSGDRMLTDNDLILTNTSPGTVDVTFSGRWYNLSSLRKESIVAVVDVSTIITQRGGSAGSYMLPYKLSYVDSGENVTGATITIDSASNTSVTVDIEERITARIPVQGTYDGTIAEGFRSEGVSFSSDTIQVSGSRAVVSQVAYAKVGISRTEYTKTTSQESEITLIDREGNEMSKDNLTLSQNTVVVTLKVSKIKDVPLTVTLIHGHATNDGNTTRIIEPAYVTISGDPEILDGINSLNVGTIDTTKVTVNDTLSFPIQLPNDVTNLTGSAVAKVRLSFSSDITTTSVSVSNIECSNVSEGYVARPITESLVVTLRGPQASIAEITGSDVMVIADLSSAGSVTGVTTVSAKVYPLGFLDVDAVGEDYRVTVAVYVAGTEPQTQSPAMPSVIWDENNTGTGGAAG